MSFEGDTASFSVTVNEEPPDVPLSSLHALPVLSPPEEGTCEVPPIGRPHLSSPRLFSSPPRTPRGSPQTRAFRKMFFAGATDQEWNDWRWQLRHRVRTLDQLQSMLVLSDQERQALVDGGAMLPVGITPYYMSLVSRNDPEQPLRRTVIPTNGEFFRAKGEADDPLDEDHDSPVPGLVHRYPDRVLLLALDFCSTYCRYCTRSRVVGHGEIAPSEKRLEKALEYIRRTPAIRDVLLSGGDPLALSEDRLDWILSRLRADSPCRVYSSGNEDAGRLAATNYAPALPRAPQVPSAVDELALHSSGRVYARDKPCLRPLGRRGHPPRLSNGTTQGRQ